jgi:hypothetical protein
VPRSAFKQPVLLRGNDVPAKLGHLPRGNVIAEKAPKIFLGNSIKVDVVHAGGDPCASARQLLTGKIRVLVVDANGHHMAPATEDAVECAHCDRARFCTAASQFLPSNGVGAMAARSMSSMQRTLTSILSGCERGT